MPKVSDTPSALKPYLTHGVDLNGGTADNVTGDCPFCGREGKLSVKVATGEWRCFSCNEGASNGKVAQGGNAYTFMRKLWDQSGQQLDEQALGQLKEARCLLYRETLTEWGLVQSCITGDWLAPGYNAEDKLNNLYRYLPTGKGRRVWQPTPGTVGEEAAEIHHQLHRPANYNKEADTYYVCEGLGDGMIAWETMRNLRQLEDGSLVATSNPEASMLANAEVLAVPGAGIFNRSWCQLFAGKRVVLMYDSDHPRQHPKDKTKVIPPVGASFLKRVVGMLALAEELPRQVDYLCWGPEGYDPKLKDGYDVKDHLSKGNDLVERGKLLKQLLDKVQPVPAEWSESEAPGKVGLRMLPCTEWKTLVNSWRKALQWGDGLNRALQVMLACIMSTNLRGDQLWFKIIGPPGCGKSTLCEAVSVNKKYVYPKSHIRGFHSGYKTDKAGKEDHGLLTKAKGKCLVTKDGDTLLRTPNLESVLAEARDIYDRTSRTHYKNSMGKDWEGINMTWLLCGTSSLRQIDSSELGERFLDCVIMDDIDPDLELQILMRHAYSTEQNMEYRGKGSGKVEEQYDADLLNAMRLAGGYIGYLCHNAPQLVGSVQMSDAARRQCIDYARFVAYLRARPGRRDNEKAERELATRLVGQLIRLSKCLAAVMNKKQADAEVMEQVRRVALDTARGRTYDIMTHLYEAGKEGLELKAIAQRTSQKKEEELGLLRFMRLIGAVELNITRQGGYTREPRWCMTSMLNKLWRQVVGSV
jgi:hypothetical protein